MADMMPTLDELVEAGVTTYLTLPATNSIADDIRAILTAVLPLAMAGAAEALEPLAAAPATAGTFSRGTLADGDFRRARTALAGIKALVAPPPTRDTTP